MRTFKNLLWAILPIFALTFAVGCEDPQQGVDQPNVVKDSVILKDSVVLVEIPMESDKSVVIAADTSFLETSVAWSQAFVNEGKLYHTLTNKDALLPVSITIPTNVHTEQREKAMERSLGVCAVCGKPLREGAMQYAHAIGNTESKQQNMREWWNW